MWRYKTDNPPIATRQSSCVNNRKVCRSDLILMRHGRHKTGRTRKGVQKDSQGSNPDGRGTHGARAQHVRRRNCQHPGTLSHVGSRLAASLRRRRPPGSSPMWTAQKDSAKHHERHPPRHRSKLVREFLRKSKNVNHAFHQRLSVPERRGRMLASDSARC